MVPKFRKGDLVVLRLKEIVVSDTSSRRIVFKCFGRVGTIEGIVNFVFGVDYDVRVSCGNGSEYVVRVNEHDLGECRASNYRSMYGAIEKNPVTDCEVRSDGVFYVLKDGSRWNIMTGEKMPDSSQAIDSVKISDALHVSDHSHRIDTPLQRIIEAMGKKIPSFVAPRYVLKMDLDNIYARMRKEKVELKDHLPDVKACNEKYAAELKRLEGDNRDLREKNTMLNQSNKLMEAELKRVKEKLAVAEKGWQEGKDEVARLMNRGFWARVFNR